MTEDILSELTADVRHRLRSWLIFKRRELENAAGTHKHDGTHVLCQYCTKIAVLEELISEVSMGDEQTKE